MDRERLKSMLTYVTKLMTNDQIDQLLASFSIVYEGKPRANDGVLLPELMETITDRYIKEYPLEIVEDENETIISNPEVFTDEDEKQELKSKEPSKVDVSHRRWMKDTKDKIIEEKEKITQATLPDSVEYKIIKFLRKNNSTEYNVESLQELLHIPEEQMNDLLEQFSEPLRGLPHIKYDSKRRTMIYHEYAIGRTV